MTVGNALIVQKERYQMTYVLNGTSFALNMRILSLKNRPCRRKNAYAINLELCYLNSIKCIMIILALMFKEYDDNYYFHF